MLFHYLSPSKKRALILDKPNQSETHQDLEPCLAIMNRLFGSGKPKIPAPNLNECIANVSHISIYYLVFFACLSAITLTPNFYSRRLQSGVCREKSSTNRWRIEETKRTNVQDEGWPCQKFRQTKSFEVCVHDLLGEVCAYCLCSWY